MGALRQIIFSCLTCNPPSKDQSVSYQPAGVCYSCSISCHGEHNLVELFNKRSFVCDCGTTRLPESAPCTLRLNDQTGQKGAVTGDKPAPKNTYNKNFQNVFCGCDENYDAFKEKGTMFQCLGLGAANDGGCGEDWWHPECIVGLPRKWYEKEKKVESAPQAKANPLERLRQESNLASTETDSTLALENGETGDAAAPAAEEEESPIPPGFPKEEDFEHFICYKCVESFPWIKQYVGTAGFLKPVHYKAQGDIASNNATDGQQPGLSSGVTQPDAPVTTLKRKAEDEMDVDVQPAERPEIKRQRSDTEMPTITAETGQSSDSNPYHESLPPAPSGKLSLFLSDDFREHLCRCRDCFPRLARHPQLLDEEDVYEPPISESDAGGDGHGNAAGAGSTGSRSLLDRGEAALSNMDRVRAIEGVMVYNHLKDKVKDFLKPFAESGKPVGAEDIKAYFEKLRGDDEAMKAAKAGAEKDGKGDGKGKGDDSRKEQSGY